MLIRLRVRGFKNLVDVEISSGPFTCLLGQMALENPICSTQ
jgi:hypothetical protein